MNKVNGNELSIIEMIMSSWTVHYSDIARVTGRSKKTIAKYLDEIEEDVRKYDVKLVRKRNVGVYFKGDTTRLAAAVGSNTVVANQGSREQRTISLLSKLLLATQPQTSQELADSAYVSRSTFEGDLKGVRRLLEEHGAQLSTSHAGLQVQASERVRRRLLAELLNLYWGKNPYIGSRKEEIDSRVTIPKDVAGFFI